MPLHRAVERLVQEPRPFLHARRERDEPLGADQAQLAAVRLVQQDLRAIRVGDRADGLDVEKVHTHGARLIRDVTRFTRSLEFDAP